MMATFRVDAVLRLSVTAKSAEEARASVQWMDVPDLEIPHNMRLIGDEIEVTSVILTQDD